MVTGWSITVTFALSLMLLLPLDVAITVRLVAVSSASTVSRPEELIVVFASLLPSRLQITVLSNEPVPITFAINCCVLPFSILVDFGEIFTLVISVTTFVPAFLAELKAMVAVFSSATALSTSP